MPELTPGARRLHGYLPSTYGAEPQDLDPIVARWLEASAFEVDRARALLLAIRATTIPGRADDTVGSLSRWERALGLPVAPAGASVEQRNAKLTGSLRGRRVSSGRQWTDAISAAIGTANWRAYEHSPGSNQLTIEIPYEPGSYSAGQVEELARRRTPANQEIFMRYTQGFIVGVSRVGDVV